MRQCGISKGFSLTELLIILAISAILVTLAVPSFRETMARSRVTGTVNLLNSSIDLVRNEAMTRNRVTVMCRTVDPFAANPSCSSAVSGTVPAEDWATGWLIYSKAQAEAAPSAYSAATDILIQRVTPVGSATSGARPVITWQPATEMFAVGSQGQVLAPTGAARLTVDHREASDSGKDGRTKCISINLLGRSTVTAAASSGLCS